jgi:hypothetical protein
MCKFHESRNVFNKICCILCNVVVEILQMALPFSTSGGESHVSNKNDINNSKTNLVIQ